MSLTIKLTIKNNEYNLIQFSYSLKQETDNFGRPNFNIQCGFIHLIVNSSENTHLVERISETDDPIEGKVIYYDVVSDQKIKEVEFFNGHIIFYEETFNADATVSCTEKITISAQNIQIGKDKFNNNWLL